MTPERKFFLQGVQIRIQWYIDLNGPHVEGWMMAKELSLEDLDKLTDSYCFEKHAIAEVFKSFVLPKVWEQFEVVTDL